MQPNQNHTDQPMKTKARIATALSIATIGIPAGATENPFVRKGLEELRTSDTHIEMPVAKAKIAAMSKKLQEISKDPGASLTRPGVFRIALHLADTFHGSTQTIHVEEIWKPFDLAAENINSFRITLLDQGWIDQSIRGTALPVCCRSGKGRPACPR